MLADAGKATKAGKKQLVVVCVVHVLLPIASSTLSLRSMPYYLHFCSVCSSLAQRRKACWYGWVRMHSFVIKIGTFPAWTLALEIASSD